MQLLHFPQIMHPRTRELLDYLEQERAALRAAFQAVPVSLRDRSPAPGRWSAAGVIEHVAIVEARTAQRLQERIATACAEGVAPEKNVDPVLPTLNLKRVLDRGTRIEAAEAVRPTGLNADGAWEALEKAGAAVHDALRSGDGLALGTVFLPHPIFGQAPLYYFFAFVAAHEARHANQLREITESLS